MLFSNVPYNLPLPPLMIKSSLNYDIIKRVPHIKFLGVFFDENVTFKKHINYLTQRLTRTSSLIYQLKDAMPSFVLKSIYYAHVNSVLSYCNLIWAGAHITTLKGLVTIQKRIIRNITHSNFDAHTAPLFKETKILNIDQIRKYNLATYFHKNELENLEQYRGNHAYPTRNRNNLRPLPHRTTTFRRSFLFQSIELWNNLSNLFPDISNVSFNKLKKLLKSSLIGGQIWLNYNFTLYNSNIWIPIYAYANQGYLNHYLLILMSLSNIWFIVQMKVLNQGDTQAQFRIKLHHKNQH